MYMKYVGVVHKGLTVFNHYILQILWKPDITACYKVTEEDSSTILISFYRWWY